ncbi:glycosyltransferase [Cryomorphaceae bacterium 1068]|nr:glycosyltransferase [Cryomorphaceae bacterium 1068]
MPRILRIINRFNLGGPTYNAAYLTKYLPPEYETMLLGGMKDETEDSSQFIVENLGITPTVLHEMHREINVFNDAAAYRKIKNIIAEFKPDIVHTHASKPGALGRWAAHQMNVPVIIHTFHGHVFHSYFNPAKTRFYKSLERKLAKISTRIIAISEKQKEELSIDHEICPAEKIEVIPLGFDLNRFQDGIAKKREVFREEFSLADDDIAVSIVGRLVPIKNHELFLDSMKWVKARINKKIKGFIVGDGESRAQLESYCSEIGLSYSSDSEDDVDIYFTSWVKNVDFVNSGSDIIALTSKNEGTPVSLIEAQAGNRAIVSTRVGGIEDVVIPDETALLSDPNSTEAFQQNLLKLASDDDLRKAMGERGWSFVKDKFHYERLARDVAALYARLLV